MKLIKRIVSAAAAFCLAAAAFAYSGQAVEGGFFFNANASLTIEKYTSDDLSLEYSLQDDGTVEIAFYRSSSSTDIVIPSIIDGKEVTSIGLGAFSACSSLTSIAIPDSVTNIGYAVFKNCTSLTSIAIPDSVAEIGNKMFMGCTLLKSITIPDSVTSIGEWAFESCSSLTSITIPDSVMFIGECAFCRCSSLTFSAIPDSVKTIGAWAFSECSSLTSVTIPKSVESIEPYAFENCKSLNTISILNPKCEITHAGTISNYYNDSEYYSDSSYIYTGVIRGCYASSAQKYAKKYNRTFVEIPGEQGDVDNNGFFSISDMVTMQKWLLNDDVQLANWKNGDLNNDGVLDVFDLVLMRQLIVERM